MDNIEELKSQLARKTQECEELKERLNSRCFDPKSNNNRCISYNRIVEDYERDLKQLNQLKVECEELRKANDEKNEFLAQLGMPSNGSYKRVKYHIQSLTDEIKRLRAENEKLREWKEANKPTGICETCTEVSVEKGFCYEQALENIKELAKGKINWCEQGNRYCNKCKCICNEYRILTIINEVLKDA